MPTKVHLIKAMVFQVVMYGCESWIIKKAEHWRIDAFELWCWRLLRVPWTARSNQSILQEMSPEYSLEGLMLTLKCQYFGHLMGRTDSLEKTLMLERLRVGREGDDRGWHGWMESPIQRTWVWASSGSWWWTGLVCCSPQGQKQSDMTEQLNNWSGPSGRKWPPSHPDVEATVHLSREQPALCRFWSFLCLSDLSVPGHQQQGTPSVSIPAWAPEQQESHHFRTSVSSDRGQQWPPWFGPVES